MRRIRSYTGTDSPLFAEIMEKDHMERGKRKEAAGRRRFGAAFPVVQGIPGSPEQEMERCSMEL